MASALAQAAHSIAASVIATAPIQPGGTIPPQIVKENAHDASGPLTLAGKSVIVGVPGAFTGTCHVHIPGFIEHFDSFKAKAVTAIYVVAVNDAFVTKAWKHSLAPNGSEIHFIADDKATFVTSLGLVFDATPLLGGPRSKRFVIVAEDNKVVSVAVESDPGQITVTDAKVILAQL